MAVRGEGESALIWLYLVCVTGRGKEGEEGAEKENVVILITPVFSSSFDRRLVAER